MLACLSGGPLQVLFEHSAVHTWLQLYHLAGQKHCQKLIVYVYNLLTFVVIPPPENY